MREVIFDRFLLFHPQSQFTYIRKLSMSCGYYMALAVVDNNNRVTHVGISNSFQIVPFKDLSDNDKTILGEERCNNLEPGDLLSVYRINRALKLEGSYRLHRPCRNMRYTLNEESIELKKLIQQTLGSQVNVQYHEHEKYDTFYTDQVDIDLWDIDFSNLPELSNDLPSFDKLGASGQTKLF